MSVTKSPFYRTQTFIQSSWITWVTDWVLGFGGKSAQLILVFTTLYMSAELYPGVNFPDGLNLLVFLTQMFALDMGCLGLGSLARQAEKSGNADGAKKAKQFSRVLVGVMIAGIVTVVLKQAIMALHIKDVQIIAFVNAGQMVVDLVLVIARAICAVLYGKIIHSLENGDAPAPSIDELQILKDELQATRDRLQNLGNLQTKIGEIERSLNAVSSFNIGGIEAKLNGLQTEIEQQNRFNFEDIERKIERDIEAKLNGLRVFIEREIERKKVTVQEVSSPLSSNKNPIPITARKQITGPSMGRKQFVYACLTEDASMSNKEIQEKGRKINLPLSTGIISTYRKTFNDRNLNSETAFNDDDVEPITGEVEAV